MFHKRLLVAVRSRGVPLLGVRGAGRAPDDRTIHVRGYAQPRKKLPGRSVDVYCKACDTHLYKYRKGGKGKLVKCYEERITEDFTEEDCICPGCLKQFARKALIHGKPAMKMIGGKVYMK